MRIFPRDSLQMRHGGTDCLVDRLHAALDAHRAGAVDGDAGLSAFLVRLHENGRNHAHPARGGRIDVDLAKGIDDFLELGHGGRSALGCRLWGISCVPPDYFLQLLNHA